MFWLQHAEEAGKAAEHAAEPVHHAPILVQLVNHYFGESVHNLQMKTTYPAWKWLLAKFGSTPEAAFGAYTPENAIPWYTIMFVMACIISVVLIWIMKGKLSEDDPGSGQQTLEVGVIMVRDMVADIIGPHGAKFSCDHDVCGAGPRLEFDGTVPALPLADGGTSVTFALGISSFIYYNYIGIKENGIFNHLKHLAGPIWWIGPFIFIIELISNFIRPFSLGIRLFGNMFADEKVAETIANLFPPYTYWLVPVFLMPLGVFVALIQTFVFILLSQLYISEVSHPPHEEHEHAGGHDEALATA